MIDPVSDPVFVVFARALSLLFGERIRHSVTGSGHRVKGRDLVQSLTGGALVQGTRAFSYGGTVSLSAYIRNVIDSVICYLLASYFKLSLVLQPSF